MAEGTIKIDTEVDSKGLETGASKLGTLASKGFGAAGKAAGVMAGAVGGAMAAVSVAMGAAVKSGVAYNAQMENYTANFKTMLGSEEAAVSKVNELKKLGASTPFEMSDLADATTTLLAFGVQADDSTGILTMLGDVSLGNADKLQRLTNSFGKVNSLGKLTGETYQMMVEAGFNPLNVIGKKTGETMEELQKRMSEGGISAEELTEAYKTATSEGGQFYKGMETASKTFDGMISTLKDNANSLVGEVVKPISDSLSTTLIPKAIDAVSTLTDAFEKDGIPGLIDAAGGVVGQIISGIASGAPKVIQMASGFLTTLLNAIIEQLPQLITAGQAIITELTNALAANLPLLAEIAIQLITALAFALIEQLPALVQCGLDLLIALMNGLLTALPILIEMLPTIIQQIVTTLLEHLPEIIQLAIQILVALVTGLVDALPILIDMIPDIISTIVTVLIDNLPLILEAAIQIILALIQGLVAAIPRLITIGPQVGAKIGEALKKIDVAKFGKDMITGLANGMTSGISKIGDAAKGIADKIKSFIHFSRPDEGPLRDYEAWMPDMITGLAGGIKSNAGRLLAETKALAAQMSQTLQPQLAVEGGPMLAQLQAASYAYTGKMQAEVGATSANTVVTRVEHTFPEPLVVEATNETGETVVNKVIEAAQLEKWFSGK